MLAKASYGPYARAMVRICKEENFHKRQGYEIVATLADGTPAQRAMAQDAVNRWWWPSLMMFGPQRRQLAEQRGAAPLGGEAEEQRRAAPAVRESHRGRRPQAVEAHAARSRARATTTRPSTGSSARSTGTEFKQVISGNGPCNRERLAARRAAHDEGAWVREAAAAYAEKQRRRSARAGGADGPHGRAPASPVTTSGRSGRCSPRRRTARRTSTPAACTRRRRASRCRTRATSTRAAARP